MSYVHVVDLSCRDCIKCFQGFVSSYTISQSLTQLLRIFRVSSEIANRSRILSLLSVLLAAIGATRAIDSANISDSLLSMYREELQSVSLAGLRSDESTEAALECLQHMVGIDSFVSVEELEFIIKNVDDVVSSEVEQVDGAR